MPQIDRKTGFPALVSHFRVEVVQRDAGLLDAGSHMLSLASVSALVDTVGEKAHIEQAKNETLPSVRLARAVTQDHFLYNWFRDSQLGKDTRADVIVTMLDSPNGKAINRWILRNAFPIKWTGPLFNALGNELAMEELDLIYDFIHWPDERGDTG